MKVEGCRKGFIFRKAGAVFAREPFFSATAAEILCTIVIFRLQSPFDDSHAPLLLSVSHSIQTEEIFFHSQALGM